MKTLRAIIWCKGSVRNIALEFEVSDVWDAGDIAIKIFKSMRNLGERDYFVSSVTEVTNVEITIEDIYLN